MFSGLMEFVLGNTFPFVVFVTYGKYMRLKAFETLTTDILRRRVLCPGSDSSTFLQRCWGVFSHGESFGRPHTTGLQCKSRYDNSLGWQKHGIDIMTGFFSVVVGCLNVIFMIAATRINAVFFSIFTAAGLGFFLLAASLWAAAECSASAANLMVVSFVHLVHA